MQWLVLARLAPLKGLKVGVEGKVDELEQVAVTVPADARRRSLSAVRLRLWASDRIAYFVRRSGHSEASVLCIIGKYRRPHVFAYLPDIEIRANLLSAPLFAYVPVVGAPLLPYRVLALGMRLIAESVSHRSCSISSQMFCTSSCENGRCRDILDSNRLIFTKKPILAGCCSEGANHLTFPLELCLRKNPARSDQRLSKCNVGARRRCRLNFAG